MASSNTFEIIERFAATIAAVQCFAGRGTKFTDKCGMDAGAARATYFWRQMGMATVSGGRANAILSQTLTGIGGHPVGGPCRVELQHNLNGGKPVGCHCLTYRANQMFRCSMPHAPVRFTGRSLLNRFHYFCHALCWNNIFPIKNLSAQKDWTLTYPWCNSVIACYRRA